MQRRKIEMIKKIAGFIAILVFLMMAPAAAESADETALASELLQTQSLENMQLGIYALPEKILNTYFTAIASDNPKVKKAVLEVLDSNRIRIDLTAEDIGELRFTCAIKEMHYDKDKAFLELYIQKKEIVGRPIMSWFVDHMSLGLLTSIYGSPADGKTINGKVTGNTIYLDLKPFTSTLFKDGIIRSLGDALLVSKATTDAGMVYIYTNLSVSIIKPAL
jgi:hypothetical protein